jgi:hypothetical protein
VILGRNPLLRVSPGAETGRYRTFAAGCYLGADAELAGEVGVFAVGEGGLPVFQVYSVSIFMHV